MAQWFGIGASVSTVRLYMSQGDLCCAHGAVKNANGQAGDTCWGKTSRLLDQEFLSAAWRAGGLLRAFVYTHMVPLRAVGFCNCAQGVRCAARSGFCIF